jgi:hypothetical protein
MADFENVSYKYPGDGNAYRQAVVYREPGDLVLLGNHSDFKHAKDFAYNGIDVGSLAVVNTEMGATYAIGGGFAVNGLGKTYKVSNRYTQHKPWPWGDGDTVVVDLPPITIGQPWDLAGTTSADAGAVSEVWIDVPKLSHQESEAQYLKTNVPAFNLFRQAIQQAIQATWN